MSISRRLSSFLLTCTLPLALHAQSSTNSDVVDVSEQNNETTTKIEVTDQESVESTRNRIEKIQVTGSHIRRTDVEGPSPVITIDREEIEASGFNTVGQLLRASTATPFGGNGSTVSLRGLGADRTLILIDGHRAPKSGSSYGSRAASANFVPLAAVERIEILTDGASATYGSDALGGVVNIITRKDMDGVSFATKYDLSDPIGGDISRTSLAYGTRSGNHYFLTSLQYTYNQGARISSFDYREGTVLTTAGAPNFLTAKSGALLAGPNCPNGSVDESTGRCIEDIGSQVMSLPGHEVGTAMTYSYDVSSDTQVYSTLIGRYTQDNSQTVGTSFGTPGVGAGLTFTGDAASKVATQNWAGKLSKANYAEGDNIRVFNRLPNNRVTTDEGYMGGLVVGAKGYVGNSDWSWDANVNNQMFFEHSRNRDQGLFNPTFNSVAQGSLKPFDDRSSQSATGLTADSIVDSRYQVSWANVATTGQLGEFAGAVWATALGINAAHFEYSDDRDDRVIGGAFMGLSGVEGGGERQMYSGFAEIAGLFGKSLETQLAVRYDQYSDFGSTFNPKLAIRYQPAKQVTFRASAGTGFSAPSLQDAYGPRLEGFYNGIVDTKKCNEAGKDPSHPDCIPNSFSAQLGSNPDLKQETSENYNVGVIVEPIRRLNFSVDYWRVKVDNTIFPGDPQKILELEAQGANISKYGANIERNDVDGQIDRITLFMANAGSEEVDGVDVAGSYTLKTSVGDFLLRTQQTYLFNYFQSFYSEFGREMVLGQGGQPRWRNVTSLGFKRGRFASQLVGRTTSRVEKAARDSGYIEQFTQFDLNFDYAISRTARVQVGALNVFDQRPALDNTTGGRINTALYRPFMTSYLAYRQEF